LPVRGFFTLNHFPGCLHSADCPRRPRLAVAPDGNTLYLAGDRYLVVAPVPADNQLQSASIPRLGKLQTRTRPWNLALKPN
jgi:hypothetical protein